MEPYEKKMAYIEFKNVVKEYKMGEVSIKALNKTNLQIEKGELAVIVGPSGAGKTTALNILGGMDRSTSGKIIIDNKDISSLKEKELIRYRREDIGFIFQFYNLVQNLTAKENVELATQICKDSLNPDEVIEKVGLKNRKNNFPSQLSGGEQQRVAIARAIAKNPKLLLCDEPTGALDYKTGKQILQLLQDTAKKENMTVLIITHNGAIAPMADKVIHFKNGTAEKTINVTTGKLTGSVTQKGETIWKNGTASIHLETEAQNLSILYQINSIEETYQTYDDTKGITGLEHGDTVFAVLSDGTNITDYTSIDVLDKLGPTVTVTQESKNTNSIQVNASSSDAEWGMPDSITYNYYIKKTADGNYPQDPIHTGTEMSYTFTGLIQNTSYDVKVTTRDKAGNLGEGQVTNITTDTVGGAGEDLKEGNIVASDQTWKDGTASITLSKGTGVASTLTIQYQVGGIEGNWTTAQEGATSVTVTGLSHNNVVYARLTDGTNYGNYASVAILDKLPPQNAKIELSGTSVTTTGSITATVTFTDNESGLNITGSKWEYNTNAGAIGEDESSYANSFTNNNNPQTITLNSGTAGTYYLHVLTVDNAGNKIETISDAITVEEPATPLPADGSFSEEKGVNTPNLGEEMTPIKWDEEKQDWIETESDSKWYDYSAKKWANAKTADGSMWVWIPRYAYQISSNYHTNSTSGGTINIKFMKGTTNEAADGTSTWSNSSGQGNWNIHPGFNYSSTASGLWVAKFEASRSNATASSEGSGNTIKIQSGVQSWRSIAVNDIYTICLNYAGIILENANLNSHMMKNTEWGACAYLAQSSYGKNAEVWINPNQNYLTGQAGSGPSVGSTTSTSAYNSGNGPQASSTGTVYGVYDMSGGAYEYTAAYVANNNGSLTSNGASLVSGAAYTKDVYTKGSADDRETNYNANSSKYGDAVYETSNHYSSSNGSWYGDYSYFPCLDSPFFIRGGSCYDMSSAGLFYFDKYGATFVIYNGDFGFRPVLVTL